MTKFHKYKNEVFYFDLKYRCYIWDCNNAMLEKRLTTLEQVHNYIDYVLELRHKKEIAFYESNKNNHMVIKKLDTGNVLIFVNGLLSKKYNTLREFRNNIDYDFNEDTPFLHYPYSDNNEFI